MIFAVGGTAPSLLTLGPIAHQFAVFRQAPSVSLLIAPAKHFQMLPHVSRLFAKSKRPPIGREAV